MHAHDSRDSRADQGPVLELLPNKAPPDPIALITETGDTLSHCSLREGLGAFTRSLGEAGLAGCRIGQLIPDGATSALTALGVMNTATCVPLNPALTSTELKQLLAELSTDALLVAPPLVDIGRTLGQALKIPVAVVRLSRVSECQLSLEWLSEMPSAGPSVDAGPALVLHTSGSTGQPKRVPVTAAQLRHAITNQRETLALAADDRCLNMMPLFHVGGLVDLLLAPLAAGGTVILASPFSATLFMQQLGTNTPTWFQGVPTMLRAIVDEYGDHFPAHRLRFIRAVSATLPPSLHRALERRLDTPVIEIYGMSETCGQITSNPLPPAARKSGSVGRPRGAEVRILDRAGNPAPVGEAGEILVRGPGVMPGYEGVDREAFSGDWFHTGDQGYFDEEGYLYLTGRLKEMINRGGEKIAPLDIDQAAAAHPAVREAAAFPVPHPSLGETVALAVVPCTPSFDEMELRNFLAKRLAPHKMPGRILLVETLPRAAGGKLQRARIAEHCGADTVSRERRPPTTPLQKDLARIWQRVLRRDDIAVDDNFFDLGGDSLKAATLAYELQTELKRKLSPAILYQAPTIERLEAVLASEPDAESSTGTEEDDGLPLAIRQGLEAFMTGWQGKRLHAGALITAHNSAGSREPLFWCVNAHDELSALSAGLGREQPVYGMRSLYQVPGRQPEHNSALARHYAREIEQIHPEGPVLIGGYCEGGKFALEIATILREKGRSVPLLVLQEQFVPQIYEGPVSLFLCPPEKQSWARYFSRPELAWHSHYRGGLRVNYLPYGHLDCYSEQGAGHFAALLREEIDAALCRPDQWTMWASDLEPLPAGAHDAEITGAAPLFLTGGQHCRLTLRVRNIGTEPWPAGERSGLFLGARWLNRRGKVRGGLAGKALLPRTLKPGFSAVVELPVKVPPRSSFRYLDIDMVEDGVCWFQEQGSTPLRKPVFILMMPRRNEIKNKGKV